MIEHLSESAFVSFSLSVTESEVAVNAKPPCVMVRVIGTVECIFFDRSEVRFNDVEPRCIGWRPDGDNPLCREVIQEIPVLVMWQVIDNDIEFSLLRICGAQAFERCEKVEHPLSLVDGPCEAVAVNIIEPKELFRARQSPVRSPKSSWMPNPSPMLTVQGFEFQGSPFIEAQNHTVLWSLMIQFKNAVFFSQTLGPETSSKFWFVVPRDLPGEGASVSIRY